MPKHINSASRIVSLLKSIPSHPDNLQTLEVWAKLFEIVDESSSRKSAAVAEHLNMMLSELELLRDQMAGANFSKELYTAALSNLEHAFSMMLLPGSWSQVRQYLTGETFVALNFCSEILPDEESQISQEDLDEIKKRVEDLASSLAASQLPPRLSALVTHHIRLIRRSLSEYPIFGAKALREAARTALGELVEGKDTIETNRDAPELQKLGVMWKKINEVADIALRAEKVSQLGQKAWAMLESLF